MKLIKLITITLILCMFVGGAAAGITYDVGSNTITVTGYTEASPCSFMDLYHADVMGGWGVVNAMLPTQFLLSAKLFIGDGVTTTWFGDINKFISFDHTIVAGGSTVFIEVATNATIRLGSRFSNTYTTYNGCAIYIPPTTSTVKMISLNKGRCDLYDCYLSYGGIGSEQCIIGGTLAGDLFIDPIPILNVYNTICHRVQLESVMQADIYNVYMSNGLYAITSLSPNINYVMLDNTKNSALQLYRINSSLTMKNLKIKSAYSTHSIRADIMTGDAFLVDCEIDRWTFFWARAPLPNVFRQYTFNLQTTPNAEITIMNHTDIVYQDYAYDNGTIDEQILTMGHYMRTTGDTLNSQNPYSIEIKRNGYHTYAQEFTLSEPIKWHILLLPDRVQVGSKIIRPARRS